MKKMIVATALIALGLGSAVNAQEVDQDGLVEVKGVFKQTLINPNVDLGEYTKIMIVPAEFEFRAVKGNPRSTLAYTRSTKSEFPMTEREKERAVKTITEAFEKEFAKSNLQIVEEPGDDVLILRGGFFDIVNKVPPEMIGAGETYVRSAGQATLFVEALDSQTGEVLYRAGERNEVHRAGRDLFHANSVTANAEVRRWASRLARKMVKGLEQAHG